MEARQGDAAGVYVLQKHLSKALQSSQLTVPAQLLCGIAGGPRAAALGGWAAAGCIAARTHDGRGKMQQCSCSDVLPDAVHAVSAVPLLPACKSANTVDLPTLTLHIPDAAALYY